MQLMKEGGKWELYIPSELGYGDRGAGNVIPPGAALIFTLELLKVVSYFQSLSLSLSLGNACSSTTGKSFTVIW